MRHMTRVIFVLATLAALSTGYSAEHPDITIAGPWESSAPRGVPDKYWAKANLTAAQFFSALRDSSGPVSLERISKFFPIEERDALMFGTELDKLKDAIGKLASAEYIGVRALGEGARYFRVAYATYHDGPVLWKFTHYNRDGTWLIFKITFTQKDILDAAEPFK